VVSSAELRAAMRRYASGIAVLSVAVDGHRLAITVGSLVSLSLDPALVGVSVGHHSPAHEPLRRAGRFALSLLAGDQEGVAGHFARNVPPIALWEGIALRDWDEPEPAIADALAWLACIVQSEHAAGDHTVVVASVVRLELGRRAPALVYVEGSYRAA
jgi:3-hydroxy-9,10-secoandrosta-1,3,5(10)-triene-9,17-dione monooxygenase reductase component